MAIDFEGDFKVDRPQTEVYAFLADPEKFCPLLPDFQSLEIDEEGIATVRIKIGVSKIKGTASIKLQLTEKKPPTRASYKGSGQVSKSAIHMNAAFELREDGEATGVYWKGELQVFGKLKALAGGLLKPLARKNVKKLIGSLCDAMESRD